MTPMRGGLRTIILLFTDVEGSTKLLHELRADEYREHREEKVVSLV